MPSLVYNQQTDVQPALTSPDAQGVRVSGAIGEGLQELGQAGTRLASDVARIDYMRQEADGVAQLQKNISDGYRNFTDSIDQWKGDPQVVQQSGAGLTKKFVGTYDDWQSQLIEQQPTPRLKRMAAEQARTMGDHFFNQTHSWEVETNRAWRIGTIQDSRNTKASAIQLNPDLYDSAVKEDTAAIEEMRGLHPGDVDRMKRETIAAYAEAASLGAAENRPQWTANILSGKQPLPQGSVPQKIVQYAQTKGVDPKAALAFAQFESGMKPDAQNGSSTGLFQVQPDTGAMYGVTDLKNPDENIKAGVGYMADNAKAFKSTFKRDPTLPELYSMHLLGTGGGMALQKAPDSEPFSEFAQGIYGKKGVQVQNANHLQGMTVGQVKAQLADWMGKASVQTQGMADAPASGEIPDTKDMPDFFRQLSPQGRHAILTHAQQVLRKDDSEARSLVKGQVNDTIAAYQRGQAVPNAPTVQSMVAAGIPYSEASAQARTLESWQQFGSQYAQFKTLPPDQGAELLKQSEPTPGVPGYAVAAETHDAATRAFQYVNQQRSEDPIRYDQGDGLQVTKPLDFNQPDVFTVQMNHRYTQAEQVARNSGTGYTPFSKTESFQIGEQLTGQDAKTALSNLALMRASAPSQDYFNAAMAQVAPTHPLLAVAGQMAQTNPQAAFTVLQGERMLHPPGKEKSDVFMPSAEKFREKWNMDIGQAFPPGLSQTSEANKQAVIAYYVAKVPPTKNSDKNIDEDTWREAIQAVVPSTQYNDRTTLVPAGSDPTKFADAIASRWDYSLQEHGLDSKDYPASAYQLMSAGVDGAYIPTQGTTPLIVNGRPLVIDLNAPQQPPPPLPPVRPPMKGRKLTADDIKRFR